MIARPCLIGFVTCMTLALPAVAQREVPDRAMCARCTIELSGPLVLQTEKMPAGLARPPLAARRDAAGRVWVLVEGEAPVVFGRNGEYLRTIGRRGEGPGEFRWPVHAAVLPGDSVLIVDSNLYRATVIRPDLSVQRTISLPRPASTVAILQWPERVVMNSRAGAPGQASWPLYLMDFSGTSALSRQAMSETGSALRPADHIDLARRFFGVTAESFWTLQPGRFQLTRLSSAGRTEQTVLRRAEWFTAAAPTSISPALPPRPYVSHAALRHDTLWVVLDVARPDWKAAWAGIDARRGELIRTQAPQRTRLRMTRIEVIDLKQHRLVTSRLINGFAVSLDEDLNLIMYDEKDDIPGLTLFRLRLLVRSAR